MDLTEIWRNPVFLTFKLSCIVAFASMATPSRGEDAAVDALRAGIEGMYVLKEWHRRGCLILLFPVIPTPPWLIQPEHSS